MGLFQKTKEDFFYNNQNKKFANFIGSKNILNHYLRFLFLSYKTHNLIVYIDL